MHYYAKLGHMYISGKPIALLAMMGIQIKVKL